MTNIVLRIFFFAGTCVILVYIHEREYVCVYIYIYIIFILSSRGVDMQYVYRVNMYTIIFIILVEKST